MFQRRLSWQKIKGLTSQRLLQVEAALEAASAFLSLFGFFFFTIIAALSNLAATQPQKLGRRWVFFCCIYHVEMRQWATSIFFILSLLVFPSDAKVVFSQFKKGCNKTHFLCGYWAWIHEILLQHLGVGSAAICSPQLDLCLSIYLSVYLFICLSICLSVSCAIARCLLALKINLQP